MSAKAAAGADPDAAAADPNAVGATLDAAGADLGATGAEPGAEIAQRRPASPPGMRERILRATLELISADGVGVLTNRRVATAAGVSLGSLTYHFSSQTQLLRESLLLYVHEETERQEALARDLGKRDLSLEQVTHEVEQIIAGSADIPQQIAELELHLQAARDPELREASARCFAAHEQIAVAALTSLGIPEGERHAPTLVALMTGLAVRRLAAAGYDAQGTSQALLALMRGLTS